MLDASFNKIIFVIELKISDGKNSLNGIATEYFLNTPPTLGRYGDKTSIDKIGKQQSIHIHFALLLVRLKLM
jgi:hypothetical protein